MIAYFTATPVSTRQIGEGLCKVLSGSKRADVEGYLRDFFGVCGTCAVDDREAACSGQVRLQGLEGINVYLTLIEASVFDVYLFGVGKKGVPSSAARWAF
jgi:hypothetical protein